MFRKPALTDVVTYVMDYARSKQLRGGWGAISECFSYAELTESFVEDGVKTKAEGLAWARSFVKLKNEQEREVRGMMAG